MFAATSSELADKDGFVGDDLVEYYAERARGGTGLIVLEATYVEQEGKRLHHNAMLHDDCFIPGMRIPPAYSSRREGNARSSAWISPRSPS